MHVVSRCRINSGGDSNSEKSSEGNSFGSSDPKSDADLHTDFSFFDHKESMQIVPPAVNFTSRNASNDFVSKYNKIELAVIRQPEEQHRARYMSEGSRGAVKDKSGKSYCTVSLFGYSRPTLLEIFASTAHGPIQSHPLYQVIAVTGKSGSATQCRECINDSGVKCLQVMLRPENKMTAILDCVGILKICSYNLKRKLNKQNRSAAVRLAFRAVVPHPTNKKQNINLQTATNPIVCVQQLGYPDVSKISRRSDSAKGGSEIFVIGKNFSGNTVVRFREYGANGCVVWSADACVEKLTRHSCHLICYTPAYRLYDIRTPVEVYLTVECGSKASRPISFMYTPETQDTVKLDTIPVAVAATTADPMVGVVVTTVTSSQPTAESTILENQPLLSTLPTLELGYPGQLDSIDACISMSGLNSADVKTSQSTCFQEYSTTTDATRNELNSFEDSMLTSLYSDNPPLLF